MTASRSRGVDIVSLIPALHDRLALLKRNKIRHLFLFPCLTSHAELSRLFDFVLSLPLSCSLYSNQVIQPSNQPNMSENCVHVSATSIQFVLGLLCVCVFAGACKEVVVMTVVPQPGRGRQRERRVR